MRSGTMIIRFAFLAMLSLVVLFHAACELSIHQAASSGDMERIEALLKENPDTINRTDSQGMTALHWAVDRGRSKIVRLLIERGADVNIRDTYHKTALDYSLDRELGDLALMLIINGAEPPEHGQPGVYSKTEVFERIRPLHRAVRREDLAQVEEMLKRFPDQIQVRDGSGRIPLYWAARTELGDMVKLLLEQGSDVNAADNDGWTPLHTAAYNGREESLRLLLQYSAGVNARNKRGETPLFWASRNGRARILEILLEAGADVNLKNNSGETALAVAKTGQIEAILRARGAQNP